METLCVRVPLRVLFVFKSYYVVWKHVLDIDYFFTRKWFKSYYVVWKQFFRDVQKDSV